MKKPNIVDNQKTPANSYLGNANVKKDGVQIPYTEEQVQEYLKCRNDVEYFVENYINIVHVDDGLVPFEPYEYQRRMFKHFNDNRFSIVLACRQSGKSISSCAYLLWCVLFHSDKRVGIIANKGSTARNMLSRITLMLEYLPFWLQPGCKALNKGNIDFSNNSQLMAASTSSSSIRGDSLSLVFLDEFAFVENAEKFYTSTYPVISSGKKTKVIITSTMNGIGNPFYTIWEGAVQGINEYKPFRVDWWDVPGRDEEWKKQTIANTSEEQFRQEYGNEAIGKGNTLIDSQTLLGLRSKPNIHKDSRGVLYYEKPQKHHEYVMTVDVSKGRGQDYSTFNVIDITQDPFRQVAVYRNNNISPMLFPSVIVSVGKMYNDAMVVIESNSSGEVVCNAVYYDFEYENTFVESMVKKGGVGVEMTKKVKRIGCSNLKDLIENSKLLICDKETIFEMTTFVSKGASYAASEDGHDDLVMNLVLFAWFTSSDIFGDMTNLDIKKMLYEERMKAIEEEVPFVGLIGNQDLYPNSEYEKVAAQQREWNDTFSEKKPDNVGWQEVKKW
jgi:hypothetical protein